ncbi:hypothetical protein IMG5_159280 [Ichthyophthirius multifiliis]|uniref:Casein kinase I n=1 Tax=Ichthyophthirius multifiliis TaxID=5932 RepID=G0QZR5_ICHMU|nr:hypothetical protein IMG5_159280 [Ichthyophthirius multifiliis]EGR29282.1 hypothetical protein IMG5_159280 [Ichthyophthirius multifiliis]|eukprot:XP_004030518.1 hypothetical protein IMG5_159280 [Ichthyophthirius multifiliis]
MQQQTNNNTQIQTQIQQDTNNLEGRIFCEQYKLIQKLGNGAFGVIYKTIDLQSNKEYACKIERSDTRHPQIIYEGKLINYLHNNSRDNKPVQGIPQCYYFGQSENYNLMIIDLLGLSLESLFVQNKKVFSLKTILMLADQMLHRIEFLHSRNFLHRDIKPDNFLIGAGDSKEIVFMIDYGLAKRYQKNNQHIPYKDGKNLTGTARYASINTHVGIEQSRRDDLESLAYLFIYFLKGQLPWQNIRAKDKKEKYEQIKVKKLGISSEELCKGCPDQFLTYLNYTKNLKFEEKPNYTSCRQLFKNFMAQQKYSHDYNWDWYSQQKNDKEVFYL